MARPRKTKEIYEKELSVKHDGNIKILGEYTGSNNKTKFKCNVCQNEWMARPETVLRGTRCPKCSNKSVTSGNNFLKNLKNKHGTRITTTDRYVKASIKMSFKCNICGNIWGARPYNILSGKGCPECANNKMKKSSEQILREIQNAHNGNIIILGDYVNGRTKTKFHCTVCGLEWLSVPAHIINGHGCPKCNFSKGESKVEKYLEKRKLQFMPQYTFCNCKHKKSLPFDYAVVINSQIILIEYDGIFHYKDVFSKKDLEGQQNRDRIKNEFCKNNGIKLIRIPYWDYENIEKILESELNTKERLPKMKILFLSPHKHLIDFLQSNGDEVAQSVDPLTDNLLNGVDFIISYGYRFKISAEVVGRFKGRAINLHISYLPWNRGADPNLWSFLEDTPSGVSIHYIDEGIDTGDILVQKRVGHNIEIDTLKTTYARLKYEIENLYKETWVDIKDENIIPMPQLIKHKEHKTKDKNRYQHLLVLGYDTPIKNLIGKAKVEINKLPSNNKKPKFSFGQAEKMMRDNKFYDVTKFI